MADSIELRSPLVDHVLVETVIGLRKHSSDAELSPKQWLRDAMSEHLIPEVLNRPKRGFEPPIKNWTRRLLGRYGEILEDGILVQHGVFKPKALAALRHFNPARQRAHMLSFDALVLEQWCQAAIDIAEPAIRSSRIDSRIQQPIVPDLAYTL
jgi:asparagine synthase (glutamine-hydrolysing)